MNKLLLATIILTLTGCGEVSAENKLSSWSDGLTLVKEFDRYSYIMMSPKGNCYLRYYGGHGSVSQVDCEDFNVKVGNHLDNKSKPVTDNSTELLEYIRDYCVVDDPYEGFPRVKGNFVVKELQGKRLSCTLPDNLQQGLSERAEYTRLKNKFGG